jgi:hypothetical protein
LLAASHRGHSSARVGACLCLTCCCTVWGIAASRHRSPAAMRLWLRSIVARGCGGPPVQCCCQVCMSDRTFVHHHVVRVRAVLSQQHEACVCCSQSVPSSSSVCIPFPSQARVTNPYLLCWQHLIRGLKPQRHRLCGKSLAGLFCNQHCWGA